MVWRRRLLGALVLALLMGGLVGGCTYASQDRPYGGSPPGGGNRDGGGEGGGY